MIQQVMKRSIIEEDKSTLPAEFPILSISMPNHSFRERFSQSCETGLGPLLPRTTLVLTLLYPKYAILSWFALQNNISSVKTRRYRGISYLIRDKTASSVVSLWPQEAVHPP